MRLSYTSAKEVCQDFILAMIEPDSECEKKKQIIYLTHEYREGVKETNFQILVT